MFFMHTAGFTNFTVVPVTCYDTVGHPVTILFHHVVHLYHGVVDISALLSD